MCFWGLPYTAKGVLCSLLHPEQREAMSLIWGIHPEHLLFINTPLWSLSLSHTVSLLCIDMVRYEFCFMNSRNQTYTRGHITKTISVTQIPRTPPGTSTNCSHRWHSSPSPCLQCHGLTKQVVLINACLKNEPRQRGTHACVSPDVFLCFMLVESFFFPSYFACQKKDDSRNSWGSSPNLLSSHDTSLLVSGFTGTDNNQLK